MSRPTVVRRLLLLLVIALVVGSGVALLRGGSSDKPDQTVVAHFTRAVSVYPGTDVRILGVTVGKVVSVTPEGETVRVEMTYSGDYDLPADAEAVIVTPTLVADRFVQLTPVYTGGPTLEDGAELPMPRTAVPVDLDRIYASLRDLAVTLGPNGVNEDGTLDHLLEAGADALRGNGAAANQMIRDLSEATATLGAGSEDLFATVEQLARFTTTLADNDDLVRAFIEDLTDASAQLAGESDELRAVLREVARAVGTVKGFVRDNRGQLVATVRRLNRQLALVNSERDSLETALRVGPLGLSNLALAFDKRTQTVGSRVGFGTNLADADGLFCAILRQSDLPVTTQDLGCELLEALIGDLSEDLPIPTGPNGPTTPGAAAGTGADTDTDDPPLLTGLGGPADGAPSLDQLLGGGS